MWPFAGLQPATGLALPVIAGLGAFGLGPLQKRFVKLSRLGLGFFAGLCPGVVWPRLTRFSRRVIRTLGEPGFPWPRAGLGTGLAPGIIAKSCGWLAERLCIRRAGRLAEGLVKGSVVPFAGHFSWFYSLHDVTMTDISHRASFLKL